MTKQVGFHQVYSPRVMTKHVGFHQAYSPRVQDFQISRSYYLQNENDRWLFVNLKRYSWLSVKFSLYTPDASDIESMIPSSGWATIV